MPIQAHNVVFQGSAFKVVARPPNRWNMPPPTVSAMQAAPSSKRQGFSRKVRIAAHGGARDPYLARLHASSLPLCLSALEVHAASACGRRPTRGVSLRRGPISERLGCAAPANSTERCKSRPRGRLARSALCRASWIETHRHPERNRRADTLLGLDVQSPA